MYRHNCIDGDSINVHDWWDIKLDFDTVLQPACSTFLSLIFLGNPLYLGSILGGTFIIAGLYIVTWGSYKEKQENAGVIADESCVSDPLIQEKTVYQKALN
ncbi:hypothetical protein Ahy_Scaffold1g107265 [Arachis hypogaea]|uniref:WAT1-related protein n=1 Tax=Arachis hypogaea TaxID=3818 RepID=A0A444WV67_ARAHY|nr:hypothetical protein Ahy_Scaffold1g107265 [Arachis hypogaea]